MTAFQNVRGAFLAGVAVLVLSASGLAPAHSGGLVSCGQAENAAAGVPTDNLLVHLRSACPLLAGIVEEFAMRDLGEEMPREAIAVDLSAGVSLAALSESEDIDALRRQAEEAIGTGLSRDDLREMLYLTVLHAGVSRAIDVTRALSDLVARPDRHCAIEAASRG